ncbi:unnamed protein product [Zymoseptoria tritici ST99CH_1A5]|uniref:Uncharacterized protein n=1 Tax=Zymoseptoria tritici ST99CH_1A5 TaxID=1276529 RepID=A0A1Y6M138_ZYMTR|nr:unnamed protein product [Zymoseptoria tritici ST99CH_1A5]
MVRNAVAEPIHLYYSKELDISVAFRAFNATSCPYKADSKAQFDRIYAKALDCVIFACPKARDGDHDFEGITRMLQAHDAKTPAHCKAKHARQEEHDDDMVQPSASKRPHLGSSGWDESCAVALDESTGEDLGWPSSDDPSWANLSWPETKDVLQQPLVDVNTAVLLQGETVQGNHGH